MAKEDASSIKHWPEDERPRERLVKFGGDALSDAQLLAILIGSGDRRATVHNVLVRLGKRHATELHVDTD